MIKKFREIDEDATADTIFIKDFQDALKKTPQIQAFGSLTRIPDDKINEVCHSLLETLMETLG